MNCEVNDLPTCAVTRTTHRYQTKEELPSSTVMQTTNMGNSNFILQDHANRLSVSIAAPISLLLTMIICLLFVMLVHQMIPLVPHWVFQPVTSSCAVFWLSIITGLQLTSNSSNNNDKKNHQSKVHALHISLHNLNIFIIVAMFPQHFIHKW